MPLDAVLPHRRSSSSSQKDIHGDEREAKETSNTAPVDLVSETESKRTSRSEQEAETRLGSHPKGRSHVVPRSDKRKTRDAVAQICRRERMESEGHDIPMEVFNEGMTKDETGGVRRGRAGEKLKVGLIRPGFTWEVGARLEAKDFMDKWYSAKIVGIDESDDSVRIHFDGWNQRYDEWVKMDSDRLRPLTRHSDRRKSQGSKMLYKVGESVYARWTDCRMYAAKIVCVNSNGTYEVMFDDGVQKTIKAINVDVKPPLSSIGSGRRPSESSGKRHNLLAPEGDINATGVKRRCDDVHGRMESHDDDDDDEDMPVEMSPVEKQIVSIKQTEDLINSSAAKRRLIHVKNLHGKSKKLLPSSSVGSGGDDETEHRCPHADCNKHFRNSTLVQYHIKYYHPDDKMPDAAKEENLGLGGRRTCISVSSEPMSDLAEKRMKARWSKSLDEYQSSVVETGDDAGDLMSTASFPSSSADPCASAVSMAIDSSLQPQSRLPSRAAFESRDRLQRMTRRRAKSLRKRRKQRMKFRSDGCLSKKVINCACRRSTESTQLIQCSLCLCWQHLHCLQVDEAEISHLPSSSYICQPCTSPARLRENAKYSFCQDWLKEGRLAEFSEALIGSTAATHGAAGKAKIMKLTHQLVADLHDVRRVIDSVNRCIFVAQDKNEGKLSNQQTANKDNGRTMENAMNKITSEQNGKSYFAETSDNVKKIEMAAVRSHKIAPEIAEKSSAAALDQSSSMQLRVSIDELSADRIHVNAVAQNGEKQSSLHVNPKEAEENFASVGINSLQSAAKGSVKKESCERDEGTSHCINGEHLGDLVEEKNRENDYLKNGGLRATMDHGLVPETAAADTDGKVTMSAPEREDKVENRKLKKENEVDEDHLVTAKMNSTDAAQSSVDDQRNQLLLYISQMQDNIEDSLEIIEEQVTALESGEGSRNSSEDILKDLPRVKKTLNQLITDVNKVWLISSFNN